MKTADRLVRENIRNLVPYSSARDEYYGSDGVFLDANENPYGTLNRYPDPYHREIRKELGRINNIPVENIFLGNGSDEVIDLLIRIFCNPGTDKALTFRPTYGMYEVSAAVNDISMIKVPLDHNYDIDPDAVRPYLEDDKIKAVFICSPNNPTGNCFSRERIIKIIESFRGMVIIDEAYKDFNDQPSFAPLTLSYDNLVVLQTFSKAMGAAGIRVGMAFADNTTIRYLYKAKPPYNISRVNQAEALRRISKIETYRKQVETLKREKKRLEEMLSRLEITETIYPSDANFLLVKVVDADRIYKMLTAEKIIVRNRNSVAENCLRITVGKRKENDILIKKLKMIRL